MNIYLDLLQFMEMMLLFFIGIFTFRKNAYLFGIYFKPLQKIFL